MRCRVSVPVARGGNWAKSWLAVNKQCGLLPCKQQRKSGAQSSLIIA